LTSLANHKAAANVQAPTASLQHGESSRRSLTWARDLRTACEALQQTSVETVSAVSLTAHMESRAPGEALAVLKLSNLLARELGLTALMKAHGKHISVQLSRTAHRHGQPYEREDSHG
jgi:hypothetical protein